MVVAQLQPESLHAPQYLLLGLRYYTWAWDHQLARRLIPWVLVCLMTQWLSRRSSVYQRLLSPDSTFRWFHNFRVLLQFVLIYRKVMDPWAPEQPQRLSKCCHLQELGYSAAWCLSQRIKRSQNSLILWGRLWLIVRIIDLGSEFPLLLANFFPGVLFWIDNLCYPPDKSPSLLVVSPRKCYSSWRKLHRQAHR